MFASWPSDQPPTWNSILNKLSKYGPVFACNGDDIEILSTPDEFYQTLIKNASKAKHRILISTLYIGQGEREKNLVNSITDNLTNNPDLNVSIIMDCSRSTRNSDKQSSSLHTLLPLFTNNNNQNVNIHLFRTPNLNGLWRLLPQRMNEIAGVHHIKAFIFDDTLIISGANLNETYLNNRQDRYFVFNNNKNCTNHVYSMLQRLSNYCPNVCYNKQNHLFNINMNINKKQIKLNNNSATITDDIIINVENNPQKWLNFIGKQLEAYSSANSFDNYNDNDTYIIMGTQMMDKIVSDSQITSSILSIPNVNMCIATAYFNFANKYNDILLNTYSNIYKQQIGSLQILTASEQCNSFYNAQGLAGYVTPLYQHFTNEFQEKIQNIHNKNDNKNDKKDLFSFLYYIRNNWTFHGKGIWIDFEESKYNQDPFSLTVVGSSNYGERSCYKDSEMNFTILTKNDNLRKKLKNEWNNLTKYTRNKDNINEQTQQSSFLVNMLSGLVRNWM